MSDNGVMTTSEALDHTLKAYGRIEIRQGQLRRESARLRDERDHWIRLFNRLEAAVSHHKRATGGFTTDADDALYAARDRILRAAAKGDERADRSPSCPSP
jgi:hypothetical protein